KSDAQVCAALKVIIKGKETFIDQQDIAKLISDNHGMVIGRKLNSIEIGKIESTLKALPYVADASVHTDMDGLLQVSVKQREVVLRIINKQGKAYYVDTQYKKIPPTLKYVPRVLVANGHISEFYHAPLEGIKSDIVLDLV